MLSEIQILTLLCGAPMHGYAIKQSFASVPINNNTLYTALNKFVKNGYVTREFVPQEKKSSKYMYSITPEGKNYLHSILVKFSRSDAASWLEFLVRLLHAEHLSDAELENIVRLRLEYLNSAAAENLPQKGVESITGLSNYQTVAEHISQRIENEKEFIFRFCRERGLNIS